MKWLQLIEVKRKKNFFMNFCRKIPKSSFNIKKGEMKYTEFIFPFFLLLFSVPCQEDTIMAGPRVWGIRDLPFTGSLRLHGWWGDMLTAFRFGPQCHRTTPVWLKLKLYYYFRFNFSFFQGIRIDNCCVCKRCRWVTVSFLSKFESRTLLLCYYIWVFDIVLYNTE